MASLEEATKEAMVLADLYHAAYYVVPSRLERGYTVAPQPRKKGKVRKVTPSNGGIILYW